MKKLLFIFAATLIALLVLSSQSALALYRWTDESRQVHISDQPNPNSPADSERLPDSSHQPSSNRPANAMQPQPVPFTVQPLTIPPVTVQINDLSLTSQPSTINPPQYDQRAAERALEQALLPAMTLVAWIGLIGLVHLLLFMMALVNIMKSEFKNNTNKILWVIIVLALPYLGVLLYFLIGRQQRVDHGEGETSFRYTRYRDIGRE